MRFKHTMEYRPEYQTTCKCHYEMLSSVVDIVKLEKTGKYSAIVEVIPHCQCTINHYGEIIDVRGKIQVMTVHGGKYGWYTKTPHQYTIELLDSKKNPTGKFKTLYNVKFYDVYGRVRTTHVLAGVAALVSYEMGSNHRYGFKDKAQEWMGCTQCACKISTRKDEEIEIDRSKCDVTDVPSTRPIKNVCGSMGIPIMQEYDEWVNPKTYAAASQSQDVMNKEHALVGNKQRAKKELLNMYSIEFRETHCDGHLIYMGEKSSGKGWNNYTPVAGNAYIDTEVKEGKLLKFAQIAGMRIRNRW